MKRSMLSRRFLGNRASQLARLAMLWSGISLLGPSLLNAQCPAYGADTTCGVVITITLPATGQAQAALTFTGQGPYDGSDDTLVGVVNNTSVPINSLTLISPNRAFGFDGDGIDTYGAPGNSMDTTGYGGPNSYFTNVTATSAVVNFITPLAPNGGTTYFSLENSLGASTVCSSIIDNAIPKTPTLSGGSSISGYPTISASFTPNSGYTLAAAATLCGFVDFDWVQTFTRLPDPSPYTALNVNVTPTTAIINAKSVPVHLGGAFNPATAGTPFHLTSRSAPFNDPPQGTGYTYQSGPDYSFPFYCDPQGDPTCAKTPVVNPTTIAWTDTVKDPCLSGPLGLPGAAYLGSAAVRALCGNTTSKIGASTAFTTHLAGVNPDGTVFDLGIGYSWTSNYNGTFGGVATTKSGPGTDPGSGTGGVTVTATSLTTSYRYPKSVGVSAVNGTPISTQNSSLTLLPGSEITVTTSGLAYSRQTQSFVGTITLTNVGSTTVTGPFNVVLDSITSGVTLINATSTFAGSPYISIPGVSTLAPGATATAQVSFRDPGNSAITFNAVPYAGSFN